MSHFGASVQRPPVPGLQGRAEYPERSRVLPFVQQILVASRSKTAIVSQVLQLPNAPSPWTLEADSQLFQKPQWGWLQDAAGKRVATFAPRATGRYFQLGSEPGRFEHHAPPHASQQHKELFELLWHAGVVKSGTRLVPVPLDLIERHRARLTRIFHDSNRIAESNGCHNMAVVSASAHADARRYHLIDPMGVNLHPRPIYTPTRV